MSDIFGVGSNMDRRFIEDHQKLLEVVTNVVRGAGKKVAFVSGTWDVQHEGHARYQELGKRKSAEVLNVDIQDVILIVGVDSDESVRERKGPDRPTIPLNQRVEQLCHSRHVDLVTVTHEQGPQWEVMKLIKPDSLIISKRVNPTDDQKKKFNEYCGEIIELESQATTSTSAIIRRILVGHIGELESIARATHENTGELINLINQLKSGEEGK